MALQIPVYTSSVTKPQEGLFIVTFNMVADDDAVGFGGVTTSASIKVRPGDNVDERVAPVIAAFQKAIDDYKASKAIAESTKMTNALTAIENGVSV